MSILASISIILLAGMLAQWAAWRLGLPSILLLLCIGFLAGPVFDLIDPDALLGDSLFSLVSLAVAVVLFEGGMSLKLRELRQAGEVLPRLLAAGTFVTWIVAAAAAYVLFRLELRLAVLLGAVLVVTGPTVIQPMLRYIRPTGSTGAILKWEGIVIDPIGALLAVLVFETIFIAHASEATTVVIMGLGKTVVYGGGLGAVAALLVAGVLRRFLMPDYLHVTFVLAVVVVLFAVCNGLQHESGLLGVTVMGVVLANQRWTDVEHIVEFKEHLRVLLISMLFVVLAAHIDPVSLAHRWPAGLAFVVVLVVVARPVSVMLATWGTRLPRADRVFLAWMAPRGIVAAAVASVFALRLQQAGFDQAGALVPITFMTIIGTVLVYGLTAPRVARRVGLAEPDPQGVLFVGAHAWARAIAEVLKSRGYAVMLVDTNRGNVAAARMAGLPAHHGSVLAEHAVDEINLGGLGRLLAMTHNDWVNVLAVQRLSGVMGRANCYQLVSGEKKEKRTSSHAHLFGRQLFASDMPFDALERRYLTGAVVKATPMSEEFGQEQFRSRYGPSAVPLFVIDEDKKLHVVTADEPPAAVPDSTWISLVYEPPEQAVPRKEDKSGEAESTPADEQSGEKKAGK